MGKRWLVLLLALACGPALPSPIGVYVPSESDARVNLVGDMLIGRVAGLEVRRSPEGHSYRIRGPRGLMGSQEPLLVLDGSPMPIVLLNSLNPRDIAQVFVERNVTIYGPRGFNGVVVVRTKKVTPEGR